MGLCFFVLIIILNLLSGSRTGTVNNNVEISSVFESFGYSPACVASVLNSCEFTSKKDFSAYIGGLFDTIKSLNEEIKSQRGNFLSEIQTLRQEVNSKRETREKNKNVLDEKLENVTKSLLNVETILQDVNSDSSDPKNCSSAVDNSTKTAASKEEIPITDTKSSSSVEENPNLKYWRNCAEIKEGGDSTSGVQTVYPYGKSNLKPVEVYCDQTTDGGGWTVIQNRDYLVFRENFNRRWQEYVRGFGVLTGEFWLGLENIHALTNSTQMELRVEVQDESDEEVKVDKVTDDDSYEDYDDEPKVAKEIKEIKEIPGRRWAKYANFHVGDETSKYVLTLANYTGDAGDGMTTTEDDNRFNMNGMMFTTSDQDNDLYSGNCAQKNQGGWWFNNCYYAHLNGYQHKGFYWAPNADGIIWRPFRGWYYSMKKASMKIRPVASGL